MERSLSRLSLLNPTKLKVLLSLGFKGFLAQKNWFRAFETKQSIDENGNAIPWLTYSFLDFVKDRINKTQHIFEFGSGNSTVFYAQNAGSVTAVEHNKEWFEKIKAHNLANTSIQYCEFKKDESYCKAAIASGKKYQIIVVDGVDRVNCCKQSIEALATDGVIILDDSERPEYREAIEHFITRGFKHIPFTGMSPGTIQYKSTSVFYRSDNCLNI